MSKRWIERGLWAFGIGALLYSGAYVAYAKYEQERGNREFARSLTQHALPRTQPVSEGGLIGRIRIDRLNLAAVIFEGTTDATLAKGVGHLAGSALPSEEGNVVLAAHRDSFFRPLKDVHAGDVVILETASGEARYSVESTSVVDPGTIEVLHPTATPTLTLITCYPFSFIGSAPDRFIVRAKKIS